MFQLFKRANKEEINIINFDWPITTFEPSFHTVQYSTFMDGQG